MTRPFQIEAHGRTSHTVRMPMQRTADWEQYVLLTSDRHWDHPGSDHAMQKRHMEEARRRSAPIIDMGDWFCLMQGRDDRRGSKKDVRPEHNTDTYFDSVTDTAADFFAPYADLLAVVGTGNHETAVVKRHEFDPTARFLTALQARTGVAVARGGYSGFVRFSFSANTARTGRTLYYHHGHGGGGAVTKGVIHTNRRAVYLPDAHIVATGHHHEEWRVTMERLRLGQSGELTFDEQLHVMCPGYKEEFGDGYDGYHVAGGRPPKPRGAVWLRFSWVVTNSRTHAGHLLVDAHRAK